MSKKVSTRYIIAKIFKDFKPSNSNWVADAIDWVGDAIQGIGYHIGMEVIVTPECDPIKVSCHRGCYPSNLESLIGVLYNGKRLPLGGDLSKYGILRKGSASNLKDKVVSDEDIVTLNALSTRLATLQTLYASNPLQSYLDEMVEVNNKISKLSTSLALTSSINRNTYTGDYYTINDDYIVTSFEDGEIQIIYVAFPTDCDGFPKIVDTYNYKQAVQWYIISRMILGGYRHPEFNFEIADERWEMFRRRSANEAKIPSIDALDRFTNMWTRAKFSRDLPNSFFAGAENELEGNLDYTNRSTRY